MMDKVHAYLCLHFASNNSTVWNNTRFFPSPFHVSTSPRLTLAGVFHVAACSIALGTATDDYESGGYVTVPCPSKVTQRSSTTDWLNF